MIKMYITIHPDSAEISLFNGSIVGPHIEYEVVGISHNGSWSGLYNGPHFDLYDSIEGGRKYYRIKTQRTKWWICETEVERKVFYDE